MADTDPAPTTEPAVEPAPLDSAAGDEPAAPEGPVNRAARRAKPVKQATPSHVGPRSDRHR